MRDNVAACRAPLDLFDQSDRCGIRRAAERLRGSRGSFDRMFGSRYCGFKCLSPPVISCALPDVVTGLVSVEG